MKSALIEALGTLREGRFVDLTHAFDANIPHCSSFDAEERVTLYHYDEGVGKKGHGFLAHEYRHPGQWGTHVDPPAHFVQGTRFQDEIPVSEMILPLYVLDISARAARDSDATPTLDDLAALERAHGPIAADSFVALYTGWDARWPDGERMANRDAEGVMHFPGWSLEVLEALHARGVLAIGHDVTDTDPGLMVTRAEAPMEDWWLRLDKWQIEMLANLGEVPPAGGLIVVSWPKPKKGSGFPCRAFAIAPR